MKFSSISLIAAGLAAIVGSTIAAPLHAHALVVDDNLFKRQPDNPVASTYHLSSVENYKASNEAYQTLQCMKIYGIKSREEWAEEHKTHWALGTLHGRLAKYYAAKPHHGSTADLKTACLGLQAARETQGLAKADRV